MVWNRSRRKWPCRPSCQRRQIIPLTKKQAVFLLIFSPRLCIVPVVFVSLLMYRTGLFFKSCYLSYWEGMKSRPGVLCWSPRRRSGKISPEVCGILTRWASRFFGRAGNSVKTVPGWKPGLFLRFLWKGFQSYHRVRRITFLCKLISKSASQRDAEICWKYLIVFLEKQACFQMYFFRVFAKSRLLSLTFKSLRSERYFYFLFLK